MHVPALFSREYMQEPCQLRRQMRKANEAGLLASLLYKYQTCRSKIEM